MFRIERVDVIRHNIEDEIQKKLRSLRMRLFDMRIGDPRREDLINEIENINRILLNTNDEIINVANRLYKD